LIIIAVLTNTQAYVIVVN